MLKCIMDGRIKKIALEHGISLKEMEMNKIKNYLYSIAMQSPLRKWALSLTGWKYWVWQLGVGGIVFAVLEYLLNIIGMTMLPWR